MYNNSLKASIKGKTYSFIRIFYVDVAQIIAFFNKVMHNQIDCCNCLNIFTRYGTVVVKLSLL